MSVFLILLWLQCFRTGSIVLALGHYDGLNLTAFSPEQRLYFGRRVEIIDFIFEKKIELKFEIIVKGSMK